MELVGRTRFWLRHLSLEGSWREMMDVYEVTGCLNDYLLSCVLEKTEKHSDDQVVNAKQTI